MKKILVIFILMFTNIVFATESNIQITFTEENAKYWQYISDRTMGGISDGQAVLDQDGDFFFARLIGNVSIANNGGFIQLRSNLSFINFEEIGEKIKGIRLNVRGNGEIYHIFIRDNQTRSYSDYYSATFKTNNKWEIVELPLTQFKNRFSNRVLDGSDIKTFAIVAYGREFISDVSVSKIIFFY